MGAQRVSLSICQFGHGLGLENFYAYQKEG